MQLLFRLVHTLVTDTLWHILSLTYIMEAISQLESCHLFHLLVLTLVQKKEVTYWQWREKAGSYNRAKQLSKLTPQLIVTRNLSLKTNQLENSQLLAKLKLQPRLLVQFLSGVKDGNMKFSRDITQFQQSKMQAHLNNLILNLWYLILKFYIIISKPLETMSQDQEPFSKHQRTETTISGTQEMIKSRFISQKHPLQFQQLGMIQLIL